MLYITDCTWCTWRGHCDVAVSLSALTDAWKRSGALSKENIPRFQQRAVQMCEAFKEDEDFNLAGLPR